MKFRRKSKYWTKKRDRVYLLLGWSRKAHKSNILDYEKKIQAKKEKLQIM